MVLGKRSGRLLLDTIGPGEGLTRVLPDVTSSRMPTGLTGSARLGPATFFQEAWS